MANVISMDLRVRFKTLMDQGLCAAAAGKTLIMSPATAARWGKKVRDGASLEPRPSDPRNRSGRLEPFMPFFLDLIDQDPDITLDELQAAREITRSKHEHVLHTTSRRCLKSRLNQHHPSLDGRCVRLGMAASPRFSAICAFRSIGQ